MFSVLSSKFLYLIGLINNDDKINTYWSTYHPGIDLNALYTISHSNITTFWGRCYYDFHCTGAEIETQRVK